MSVEKLATSTQAPTDVDLGLKAAKEFGLPLVCLVVLVVALWKLGMKVGGWMAPRIDDFFKALLASNARVPELIEANRAQSAAVLLALEKQNALIEGFCDRLDDNNAHVARLAEHVARLPKA